MILGWFVVQPETGTRLTGVVFLDQVYTCDWYTVGRHDEKYWTFRQDFEFSGQLVFACGDLGGQRLWVLCSAWRNCGGEK